MDLEPFWMIQGLGPSGYSLGPPTFRHKTQVGAVIEAERLARENPGKTFVVLETVAAIRKRDVEVKQLGRGLDDASDDIPF